MMNIIDEDFFVLIREGTPGLGINHRSMP